MTSSHFERRAFLLGGLRAAVACATTPFLVAESAAAEESFRHVFGPLDEFIAQYMRAQNSPGLTLALANTGGTVRTAAFGFSDLEVKVPVTPDLLFEIGSITKSFVALTLLQLREEGKLDLERPILEYLPWLPIEEKYGPITAHHLLTHTSGLPDALVLFLPDPHARHVQGFKPGEHFHYCNIGFGILGYLIENLDGRPWSEAVQSRIMRRLGMTSSATVITNANRKRTARSYVPFYDDLTYSRQAPLACAGNLLFDDAAGSIVSTPRDMSLYLQMLLQKGQGPRGRVVTEQSFALFSNPYIKAEELSPTASYGYGIGVDQLDGHTILRHTGGAVSFMSAMHVDLDGGVAGFASINAGQGYRPNPVTEFAVRLMNAQARAKPLPKIPDLHDPMVVTNASEYAGSYTSVDGRTIGVAAEGERLIMNVGSQSVPLQSAGKDTFLATVAEFQRFPVLFGRGKETPDKAAGSKTPPVVELMHGADWFTNEKYAGPHSYPAAPGLEQFVGHYRADSAWFGSMRVVLRKGRLWLDGSLPLEPLGEGLFRVGDEGSAPETVEFYYVVNGKARLMKFVGAGADLRRINVP